MKIYNVRFTAEMREALRNRKDIYRDFEYDGGRMLLSYGLITGPLIDAVHRVKEVTDYGDYNDILFEFLDIGECYYVAREHVSIVPIIEIREDVFEI